MSTTNPLCTHTFFAGEKILRQIKTIAGCNAQGMNRKAARCGLTAKNAVDTPIYAPCVGVSGHAPARRSRKCCRFFMQTRRKRTRHAAGGSPRRVRAHHCRGWATGVPGSASGRVEPDGSGAAGRAEPADAAGAGNALARCSISAPRLSMALA